MPAKILVLGLFASLFMWCSARWINRFSHSTPSLWMLQRHIGGVDLLSVAELNQGVASFVVTAAGSVLLALYRHEETLLSPQPARPPYQSDCLLINGIPQLAMAYHWSQTECLWLFCNPGALLAALEGGWVRLSCPLGDLLLDVRGFGDYRGAQLAARPLQ